MAPSAITRMEETLGWLRWLEPQDAKLVWARSSHALEGDLLALRNRARDGTSTLAIWSLPDCVEGEWP